MSVVASCVAGLVQAPTAHGALPLRLIKLPAGQTAGELVQGPDAAMWYVSAADSFPRQKSLPLRYGRITAQGKVSSWSTSLKVARACLAAGPGDLAVVWISATPEPERNAILLGGGIGRISLSGVF